MPHFPNLFLMYGPNTNIVINGSIIYFSECEAQFIVESIGMLLRKGLRAMEPKKEVHDAYNVLIDEGNQQMAWGVSDVNTWYRNAKGRIAQNWPFDLVRYWRQTRNQNRMTTCCDERARFSFVGHMCSPGRSAACSIQDRSWSSSRSSSS